MKLSIINILQESNEILDLKKGFDKTLENMPTVSEQVRSFPCQQCGHMYYSEIELNRHIKNFDEEK